MEFWHVAFSILVWHCVCRTNAAGDTNDASPDIASLNEDIKKSLTSLRSLWNDFVNFQFDYLKTEKVPSLNEAFCKKASTFVTNMQTTRYKLETVMPQTDNLETILIEMEKGENDLCRAVVKFRNKSSSKETSAEFSNVAQGFFESTMQQFKELKTLMESNNYATNGFEHDPIESSRPLSKIEDLNEDIKKSLTSLRSLWNDFLNLQLEYLYTEKISSLNAAFYDKAPTVVTNMQTMRSTAKKVMPQTDNLETILIEMEKGENDLCRAVVKFREKSSSKETSAEFCNVAQGFFESTMQQFKKLKTLMESNNYATNGFGQDPIESSRPLSKIEDLNEDIKKSLTSLRSLWNDFLNLQLEYLHPEKISSLNEAFCKKASTALTYMQTTRYKLENVMPQTEATKRFLKNMKVKGERLYAAALKLQTLSSEEQIGNTQLILKLCSSLMRQFQNLKTLMKRKNYATNGFKQDRIRLRHGRAPL